MALLLAAAIGLSGCGGMSKMQDILTDKPAKKDQQQSAAPKPATQKQTPAEGQPSPMALPPAQ